MADTNGAGTPSRKFTYNDFTTVFKAPANAKFRKALSAFAKGVSADAAKATNSGSDAQTESAASPVDPNNVRSFIASFTADLRQQPGWKDQDAAEWRNSCEGVEKYAMLKLFPSVFAKNPEDLAKDRRLERKARCLATFIDFEHLDIDSEVEELVESWSNASKALQRINQYRSPRDKVVCLLNCCLVRAEIYRCCHVRDAWRLRSRRLWSLFCKCIHNVALALLARLSTTC